MASSYSEDLKECVIKHIEAGNSYKMTALLFDISERSIIRWRKRWKLLIRIQVIFNGSPRFFKKIILIFFKNQFKDLNIMIPWRGMPQESIFVIHYIIRKCPWVINLKLNLEQKNALRLIKMVLLSAVKSIKDMA
jgi:hypothetical protein